MKKFSRWDLVNQVLLFSFILLLPTQLGRHFFAPFSYINGLRIDYLAPTIYLTDLLVLLLIFLNFTLIKRILTNKPVLIFFGLLAVQTLFFAQSKEIAWYRYLKLFEIVFLFFLFRRKPISYGLTLLALVIGVGFESMLAVWQFIIKHSVQGVFWIFGERYLTLSLPDIAKASLNGVEILRPYGTFSHPNSMAGFYLLLYTFILTRKTGKKTRVLSAVFLFASSVLILLSFSKVAIATYVAVTIAYLVLKKDFSCKLCFLSRVLTLGVMGFAFMRAQTDPLSLSKRGALISQSFTLLGKTPLQGVGLGNYLVAQSHIRESALLLLPQPVHNIFLYVLVETGLIVFLVGAFFLVRLLYRSRTLALTLCLFVVGVTGIFDHYWVTLQQNWLLLPVIFGLVEGA